MLVPADLADFIRSSMGFPLPVSTQLLGWSTAVINHIISDGRVNFSPGQITGDTTAGGSLSNGAGTGGNISGLSGSVLAPLVVADVGYPFVSTILQIFCNQITTHVMTGLVSFQPGQVTGQCTSTNSSPGSLVNGAATGGKITGLSGPTLANNIHVAVGYPGSVSVRLTEFCTAIVTYLMSNADVTFTSGEVTGTCPTGAGALSGGAASNGMFS